MCAEVQQRLQQFSREVLDLLKNQGSHCRLPVSKFVSAYHQYFSRQCRVADYGFSKIIDLLSAIPKSIQILGDGNKRIMTITHRCQMKRFTNDIIRILKNKPQRSMSISEIPIEYGKLFDFQIRKQNYGNFSKNWLIKNRSTLLILACVIWKILSMKLKIIKN